MAGLARSSRHRNNAVGSKKSYSESPHSAIKNWYAAFNRRIGAMPYRTFIGRTLLIVGTAIGSLWIQAFATVQTDPGQAAAVRAVRSFYTFHLARNKDFTVRNIQLRRRFLSPELYDLLLKELKRQAAARKAHPDEAPYFEGDPLTDSQEYPDSFRIGTAEVTGEAAKVTVTLQWSARTSRGRDKRDIVVELTKGGSGWLINDVVNNQGIKLRDELKREH